MRAPEFEASLAEAKLYPQLWRLCLGVLLIGFVFVSAAAMTLGAILAAATAIDPAYTVHVSAALRSLQAVASGYGGIDTPLAVFILLATFGGMFLGPLLAAAALHFRGPGSLFGDFPDWARGFGTALAIQLPILTALALIGAALAPPSPNLDLGRWLWLLPVALPLILLQTGAEELLFRGYLQQQLAARFAARWLWMGLPAVIFAALHWMPQAGANLPILLGAAFVFGLLAADLTEQTGNLGAAMGLHFGNNVFGMLVLAVDDTITGLALYVSPQPVDATGAQSVALGASVLVMLLIWRIVRHVLTR